MPGNPYLLFLTKFDKFTEIQELAFPVVKSGENCIISSHTGSGKTEAALLPVLELIAGKGSGGIIAIYITPLKALNRDLLKRLNWLCSELGINIKVRHGDTTAKERREQSLTPPQLVVITPESLQNLFLSPRLRESLKNLKVVIVDELHELYYNKRGAQLSIALERLEELSRDYQRIGISATIGNISEAAEYLFGPRKHKVVSSISEKSFGINIEMPVFPRRKHSQFKESFGLDDSAVARIERIGDLVKESDATLIFANTRQVVESLGSKLVYLDKLEGFGAIGIHHSSLDKEERIQVENKFKEGVLKGIIATSSLELGIDIGKVNRVIQYGSPRQAIRLIQRVGRGGHTEKGVSNGTIIVSGPLEAIESGAVSISLKNRSLETQKMERNALDVLVNQISGFVLEYKKIEKGRLYQIVKRAAPYASLDKELFEKVLGFAAEHRLINLHEGIVSNAARTRDYYIKNISVLPDSPRFYVRDAVRNKIVSTLDDRFVHTYIDYGSVFITKGLSWKVLSIEEDTIFVEQSSEVEAAIPDWEGEDIPVPYNIAQTVVSLFSDYEELGQYLDHEALGAVLSFIKKQSALFLPDNNTISIEQLENYAIIYTPLGKQANEFLSKMLVGLINVGFKGVVAVRATPYAIILDFSSSSMLPNIYQLFELLKNSKNIIENKAFVINSELFRYKFVQIAKLFGIVDKKATITKSMANKIIAFYKDSVIYDEALRDLKKNYFDIDIVKKFLEELHKNRIKINVFHGIGSPLSGEILRSVFRYRELLVDSAPREEEIAEFEGRFKDKKVMLLCNYCGFQFQKGLEINSVRQLHCPSCSSTTISSYKDQYYAVLNKKLGNKKLTNEEREVYDGMAKEAGLVSAYGDRALVALLTYGVGLSTAARILKMVKPITKEFIKDLISAQKLFVKTSGFWRNKKKPSRR